MPEKLYDMLGKISSILHWLGKYEDSNEIAQLAQILSSGDFRTSADLVRKLLYINTLEQILDEAANEDESGCYKIIQEWQGKENAKVDLPKELMKPA